MGWFPKNAQTRSVYGSAIALGTNMAAGMAIFTFGGYKLDQRQGGGRTWTLCGIFLGLAYGGYEVWKLVRQIQAAAESEPKPPPPRNPRDFG